MTSANCTIFLWLLSDIVYFWCRMTLVWYSCSLCFVSYDWYSFVTCMCPVSRYFLSDILGVMWLLSDIHGVMWLLSDMLAVMWLSSDILGVMWLLSDILGVMWLLSDIHGVMWPLTLFRSGWTRSWCGITSQSSLTSRSWGSRAISCGCLTLSCITGKSVKISPARQTPGDK